MFWEHDDRFIIIRVGGIVWMPREGVSSVQGARLVDKLDIILLAFCDVSYDTRSDLVCMSVELEVCMVSDDKDRMRCTFKQVIPMFKSLDDHQEFPIIDRVTLFCCGESLGVVATWAKDWVSSLILEFSVSLEEDGTSSILRSIDFQDELSFRVWGNKNRF
jgi:hypothetical protein